MKNRRRFLFVPFLLLSVGIMAELQLKIVPLGNAEQQVAVEKIGKITFIDNVMYLYDNQGKQLGYTNVENIAKIVFSDGETTSLEGTSEPSIQVYPNPTQESIYIKGVERGQTVRIYSLQGQQITSTIITGDELQLYVGNIQNGTYLLQVGAQIVKLIKK